MHTDRSVHPSRAPQSLKGAWGQIKIFWLAVLFPPDREWGGGGGSVLWGKHVPSDFFNKKVPIIW